MVKMLAETVSENDPAHDTKLGYTMTLGRSLKDERSIAGDGTYVLHSRPYQALVASVSPRSHETSNLCRAPNICNFSHASRNAV